MGNDQLIAVAGNETTSVGKDRSTSVGSNETLEVGRTITISAGDQIVLKTGLATIALRKNGDITIEGKQITIKASGDVIIKGAKNPSKIESTVTLIFPCGSRCCLRRVNGADATFRPWAHFLHSPRGVIRASLQARAALRAARVEVRVKPRHDACGEAASEKFLQFFALSKNVCYTFSLSR